MMDLSDRLGWPPLRLWLAPLDAWPDATRQQVLSDEERARAARFVFERDQRRFTAAHCLLRERLAQASGLPPAALRFQQGPHGKPYLLDAPGLSFNLSHSGDWAAVVVAPGGEVGVDVEVIRTMSDVVALTRGNFTPQENDELLALPEAEREAAFLCGWTRKEACLKALGSGLSLPAASFHAGLAPTTTRVEMPGRDGPFAVELRSLQHGGVAMLSVAWQSTP
ncbi:4'-phosphopantetheinyl transferase family protein [Eleftheria terrae]|uniref:4'-phosphopantetheinyl transferase family protein n=1 Tax=Eleftheria terrae TaxID=1597781 RepID=UPI00263B6C7C|nr:4'-phosphopantetheinyl transferase superfamily protein [Eleftheria terrae]WKB53896.1 4'-phosphopantetheinyl transferase superfamily protein [Eleftheria terrae]